MGDDDIQALKALYPPLRRFAGIVAPLGVEPDDLVQEAFTRIVERGGLHGIDDPLGYLRRAIVNRASNERRHVEAGRRALLRHGAFVDTSTPTYPSDLAELLRI